MALGALLDGSADRHGAHRRLGAGAFGLVALARRRARPEDRGAASGPFVESLEELLVATRITPMAYPFARPRDVRPRRPVRLVRPRPLHVAAAADERGGVVGRLLGRWSALIRELADGIWSCEQDDGPRIVRQVVVAGDEAALVVDTGLPGARPRELLPLVARLGTARSPC